MPMPAHQNITRKSSQLNFHQQNDHHYVITTANCKNTQKHTYRERERERERETYTWLTAAAATHL